MGSVGTTSPVLVAFCCTFVNGELYSQPACFRMSSVMAELSAVRASGFRKSVQFDLAHLLGLQWPCFRGHVESVWPWPRCQAKVKQSSLLMDVSSLPATTRAAASC